ncbi:MAG: type IX secretion system membrane protein PorP/SprF [Prevotellaceae bacterium]|jgi:type IX secretion system PorP/SprF family membrane protein|nr:type IX secretion system membrane protein PorP/SprF [Prevotellaceae bacterium]
MKEKIRGNIVCLIKTCEKKIIFTRLFVVCIVMLTSFPNSSYSQFDGKFSQYMNNLCLINPAYVGEQSMMQVSIFQRTQWLGMKGAPITSVLSADMPLKIFNSEHGLGIQFVSDIFSVFNNQQANFSYSYKYVFKESKLNFGATLGFINIICNGDSINISKITESDYHHPNDPKIPTGKQSGVGFNLGLGAQFLTDNYRVGLSLSHITSPSISLGDQADFKIKPLMQIHGGYDFSTRNPDYKIRTNVLIVSDFTDWTTHFSVILDIKNKFWAGAGYGLQDAVSLMFGIKLFEGFDVGYTFDLPTNKWITNSFGTHEIFATYEFALVREKSKAFKSLRIL